MRLYSTLAVLWKKANPSVCSRHNSRSTPFATVLPIGLRKRCLYLSVSLELCRLVIQRYSGAVYDKSYPYESISEILQPITAPFNNMRTLNFNTNQRIACFTAVSHNYGDNRLTAKIQKPTKWIEIRQSQDKK